MSAGRVVPRSAAILRARRTRSRGREIVMSIAIMMREILDTGKRNGYRRGFPDRPITRSRDHPITSAPITLRSDGFMMSANEKVGRIVVSREAAQEYSPQRKLWAQVGKRFSPEGAQEKADATRTRRAEAPLGDLKTEDAKAAKPDGFGWRSGSPLANWALNSRRFQPLRSGNPHTQILRTRHRKAIHSTVRFRYDFPR